MARRIEEIDVRVPDLEDARIVSQALPFERAEDLLPEIVEILGGAFDRLMPLIAAGRVRGDDDIMAVLPLLPVLAAKLGQGRLASLAARLLVNTSVILSASGEKTKYDLVDAKQRAAAFDERPDLYLRSLAAAVKVTYARFFPGFGRRPPEKKAAAST